MDDEDMEDNNKMEHQIQNNVNLGDEWIQFGYGDEQEPKPDREISMEFQEYIPRNQRLISIVVDTNVLLNNLHEVDNIILNKWREYLIYVPRKVLEELDRKKVAGSEDIRRKARYAHTILYEAHVAHKNLRRIIFQNDNEAQVAYKMIPPTKKADDLIVATCVKLKSEGKKVLLFTNDKNMRCVAAGFKIDPYPFITQEIVENTRKKMKRRWENNDLFKKILETDGIKRKKINAILNEDDSDTHCEKWLVFYKSYFKNLFLNLRNVK